MSKSTRYLLDTHVFLWAIGAPEKLSENVRTVLLAKESELFFSRASYWELCLKVSKGTLSLSPNWQSLFEVERQRNRWNWLELMAAHCEGIIDLPKHHKDPFDRILLAQAKAEDLTLISCDRKFSLYEIPVLW